VDESGAESVANQLLQFAVGLAPFFQSHRRILALGRKIPFTSFQISTQNNNMI
jgi:hypothetical protein